MAHVGKSAYAMQLRRWFDVFGQENFKVTKCNERIWFYGKHPFIFRYCSRPTLPCLALSPPPPPPPTGELPMVKQPTHAKMFSSPLSTYSYYSFSSGRNKLFCDIGQSLICGVVEYLVVDQFAFPGLRSWFVAINQSLENLQCINQSNRTKSSYLILLSSNLGSGQMTNKSIHLERHPNTVSISGLTAYSCLLATLLYVRTLDVSLSDRC